MASERSRGASEAPVVTEAPPAPALGPLPVAQLTGESVDDRAIIGMAAAGMLSNHGLARFARERQALGRRAVAREPNKLKLLGPVEGAPLPPLPVGANEDSSGGPPPQPPATPPPAPVKPPPPAGDQPSSDKSSAGGTPPVAAPPAGTPAPAGDDSWYDKAGKYLSGEKKVTLRIGSWNLWNKQATRGHAMKPENKLLQGVTVPLVLLPVPPPVGPVLVTLKLNANAYAGARATVSGQLRNLEFDATVAQLAQAGIGLTEVMSGGLAIPGLITLAGIELPGRAQLLAEAEAGVDAGVAANAEVGINPEVWPIAGYIKASLGINGNVGVRAKFDGRAALKMTALGITVTDFSSQQEAALTAGLGIVGTLEAGADIGYLVTARQPLLVKTFRGGFDLELKQAIEGGKYATLSVGHGGGSNEPTLDLQRLAINVGNALEWLVKKGQANDNATPFKSGQAPTGQPPVDLLLPQSKSHHLDMYRGMLGRLHHRPGTSASRGTDQTTKWLENVRAEGAERLVDKAIDLGMFDDRVEALAADPAKPIDPAIRAQLRLAARADDSVLFRPRWNRTRRTAGRMNADHKIEYQTYPVDAVDEPWNFELLDGPTNSSAGSTIMHYMTRIRAALPPEWQNEVLYFTTVTGGGGGNLPRGETWQTDQIVGGEQLEAFERLYPEVVAAHRARNFPAP